eukprot:Skav204225  [mRNA]  locus=scaffold1550:128382:135262:- [translate_table: standard]
MDPISFAQGILKASNCFAVSRMGSLSVLDSEREQPAFQKEREAKAALTQLERDTLAAERLAKEAAKIKKRSEACEKAEKSTKVKSNLVPLVKEFMNGSPLESHESLLSAVLQQHISCRACGRMSSREAERALCQAGWSSYDDVPNATEEEIQQYPRVLATFYQQAQKFTLWQCATQFVPPLCGVRRWCSQGFRLMELYKKKTWDMATPEFQRLVRMDPENDISNMDPMKLNTFTPDFDREKGKEQENFEDLQARKNLKNNSCNRFDEFNPERINVSKQAVTALESRTALRQVDVPLELVMADATAKWRSELQEKLDDEGYLLEDVDARGQRPARV